MNGEYRTMYDVLFDIAAIWKACKLFNAVYAAICFHLSRTEKCTSTPSNFRRCAMGKLIRSTMIVRVREESNA